MAENDFLWEIKNIKTGLKNEISLKSPSPVPALADASYKVRKVWFKQLVDKMGEGIRKNYLDNTFLDKYQRFHKYLSETKFQDRNTEKNDVDYANRILDEVIKHIETKVSSKK